MESTKAILKAYTDNGISVIGVVKGGFGEQGTWGTREIALEVAMWISPSFKIWCLEALDELFQKGSVSLNKPQTIQEAMQVVIDMQQAEIEAEERRKKHDSSRIRYQNYRNSWWR